MSGYALGCVLGFFISLLAGLDGDSALFGALIAFDVCLLIEWRRRP